MPEKILIVEDEATLRETLAYNLKNQGYVVNSVADGKSALEKVRTEEPDLILLDIMLPGLDGFEVCRELRKVLLTPILMLTARDNEIDRVVGLEVGADDYLTKPFSMRELIARVKALLRRVRVMREAGIKKQNEKQIFSFQNLVIDENRREVMLNGNKLDLKPKEYDLLAFFAVHQGEVLSRELILEKVWGWDYFGDSRTVDVHTRWLREKIEINPADPKRIMTVRGAGYRFDG